VHKIGIILIVSLLGIAGGICVYNGIVNLMMRERLSVVPRDPVTGIMKGAEPVVLKHASSKKAALLIHGFIGTPTDFGRLPELLHKDGFDVYVPLLPGHGTDPRNFAKTTADRLESFVLNRHRLLTKEYEEVVLIGFSMGGALTALTAVKEPVDKLVLLAPYFKISHQWYYVLPAEWYQKAFRNIIPYTYRPLAFKQVRKREAMPFILDYNFVSLKGGGEAIELGRRAGRSVNVMGQPTLIVHSRYDKATDYNATRAVAKKLSGQDGSKFVTLENSNHVMLWDYDAELVENEILKFV